MDLPPESQRLDEHRRCAEEWAFYTDPSPRPGRRLQTPCWGGSPTTIGDRIWATFLQIQCEKEVVTPCGQYSPGGETESILDVEAHIEQRLVVDQRRVSAAKRSVAEGPLRLGITTSLKRIALQQQVLVRLRPCLGTSSAKCPPPLSSHRMS